MTRALVLNASYEPLAVIPLKRAVILVLDEKAEIVSARDGEMFRSASVAVDVPTVIRLRRFVKVPYHRGPGRPTLRGLIARDGRDCAYCTKRVATTIDHVHPRSRGGQHTWENTVGACEKCNHRKADRTPREAGMTLRVTPHRPAGTNWLIFAVADIDPSWVEWVPSGAAPAVA